MRNTGFRGALIAMLAAAAVGLSAAACGGGSDDGNGGDATKAPAVTAAATSAATAASTQPASNGAAAGTVDLVAKNTLWDKTELEATAGKVTFNIDNQDAGLVHNFHVFKGTDNKGEDLGATELEAGPVKQKLELTLEAGEYFFTCDAHPATMSGKLEVE